MNAFPVLPRGSKDSVRIVWRAAFARSLPNFYLRPQESGQELMRRVWLVWHLAFCTKAQHSPCRSLMPWQPLLHSAPPFRRSSQRAAALPSPDSRRLPPQHLLPRIEGRHHGEARSPLRSRHHLCGWSASPACTDGGLPPCPSRCPSDLAASIVECRRIDQRGGSDTRRS